MTAHVPSTVWTDEHVAQLRQYWIEGLSCSQIATAMDCGITRNAVIGKANRLGLSERRKPAKPKPLRLTREEMARRQRERSLARTMGWREPVFRREKIVPTVPPPESLHVSLLDLDPKSCRFPDGDGPFLFCGRPRMMGSSYCEHCHKLTHQRKLESTGRSFRQNGWRA